MCIANLTDGTKIAYVKRYIERASQEIADKIREAETAGQTRLNQPLDASIRNPNEKLKGQFSFSNDVDEQEQRTGQGGMTPMRSSCRRRIRGIGASWGAGGTVQHLGTDEGSGELRSGDWAGS